MRDLDHDAILILRQLIPSSAERTQFIARERVTPAQRVAACARSMNDPPPYLQSFGRAGADSYIIRLLDPWSTTLAGQEIKDADALLHLATIWGTVAGSTHHQGNQDQAIGRRMNAELLAKLKTYSSAYLKELATSAERLRSDQWANGEIDLARQAISTYGSGQ